jgi:hypothetical protein
MDEQEKRAAVVQGLRELADVIERHPDAPLPFLGEHGAISVFPHTPEELAEAARCYGGEKQETANGLVLCKVFGAVHLQVHAWAAGVCERVEVGTKPVSKQVEGCPRCASPVVPVDGGKACRSGGRRHFFAPAPVLVEVVENEPVYEVRCPDSVLRPASDVAEVSA